MSIQRTEAIVLNKHDFRETSLIVNFYTRDFGKFSGLLKGIRTDQQKFASTVELFSDNEIIFYRNRSSSLYLVSQCDLKDNFTPIRQEMIKVGMASMIIELLDSVMSEEDINVEIFDLTLTALKELELTRFPDKVLTIFKIKLLSLSGFKPHLDSCLSCDSRILGESKFSLSKGGLLCPRCYKKDIRARAIFRGTIASILHIEKNTFKSNLNLGMNLEIKKELELVLNAFLSFHLEKELKSQRVLHKLAAA